MMTGLSFWVRHLIGLLEDIVLRDATGRIARFLIESEPGEDGTVKLPSLKRHVASHLNLTSETFSRTFGRLIEAVPPLPTDFSLGCEYSLKTIAF
ncbi:MAG: helix-turn-helix domain-containing protein [Planctomycetota bacterium]|nr:helix-turn-helix domain-containing protein [Planctomycetota bacterium]